MKKFIREVLRLSNDLVNNFLLGTKDSDEDSLIGFIKYNHKKLKNDENIKSLTKMIKNKKT